jgi:hypothetical protein
MEEADFNAINWATISDEEFRKYEPTLSPSQGRTARSKRPKVASNIVINRRVFDPRQGIQPDQDYFFQSNIFDILGAKYELHDPIGFFKYFFAEAAKSNNKVVFAQVFNELFDVTDQKPVTEPRWPFGLVLKPALRYQKSSNSGGGDTYVFPTNAGADAWREALIKLMALGFTGTKNNTADQLHASLNNAMLEANFVEDASAAGPDGQTGVKIFWRCDSRDKYQYIDQNLAISAVDSEDSSRKFHLKERWNPFFDTTINRHLWLRKSSGDNDYYTIVSVGLDFKTCAAFPTLDEKKCYSFPILKDSEIKPLDQWTAEELLTNEHYIAQVRMVSKGVAQEKFRLVTKAYGYMVAINRGMVINTQEWGGQGLAATEKFPERGIRGMPRDAVVGYIPLLRVHLGGSRSAGFTAYLAPGDNARLLLSNSEIDHRFGRAADKVRSEFDKVVDQLRAGLRTAWAKGGSAEPSVSDTVVSITRRMVLRSDIEKNKGYLT